MSHDCIGCNPDHESGYLCPDCRRHAELGRAVERMPERSRLKHGTRENWYYLPGPSDDSLRGAGALEALRAAGLGDEQAPWGGDGCK